MLNKNISGIFKHQCTVQVCTNNQYTCDVYNITIPDIDITNRRILQKSNLFYYQWQKPNHTIELQASGPCDDDMKLYVMLKSATQGEVILSFSPSTMVVIEIMSCYN